MTGPISGPLDIETTRKIFGCLIDENPISTWMITDGIDEKVIHFSGGGLKIHSTPGRSAPSIEEYLVDRGDLVPAQLTEVRRLVQTRPGMTLVRALSESNFLDPVDYQQRLQELVLQQLDDIVVWQDATMEFRAGTPPEFFHDCEGLLQASLEVPEVISKVLLFLEHWAEQREILHGELAVPVVVPSDVDLSGDDPGSIRIGHLLAHINGKRTLREIVELGGLGPKATYSALVEGVERGVLAIEPPPGPGDRDAASIWKRIEEQERQLSSLHLGTLARRHLLSLFEQLGSPVLVSHQLQVLAVSRLEDGDPDEAIENFRRAIKVYPESFSAHEAIIEIHFTLEENEQAMVEILALARKLVGFRLVEAAQRLLRKTLDAHPLREELRLFLIELYLFREQNAEAVQELLFLARQRQEHSSWDEALDYFQKARELDPNNPEVRSGLRRIQKILSNGRRLRISRVCAAAAIVMMAAWIVGDGWVRHLWASGRSEILEQVESGDLRGGLERLEQIAARFPNRQAEDLLEAQEELFRERFYAQEASLQIAFDLSEQGRCLEAMQILEEVAASALVPGQRERATRLHRDVKGYRQAWLKMRRRAERHLEANFRKEAFSLARRVIESYPEGAIGLKVPLLIQTRNPGARVHLNGELWGYTPLWIILEYGADETVEIHPEKGPPRKFQDLLETRSFNVNLDL